MNFKPLLSLLLLIFLTNFSSAQYTFDGSYCPGPGEPGDEYGTASFTIVDPSPSSTCEIGTVWAGLSETNGAYEIFVGLFHGNSGQSTFRFYFNTDCDATTGGQTDFESGSSGATAPVGGAEFRISITSNGSSTIIEEWDPVAGEFTTTTSGVMAAVGNSDGCTGADGQFKEITIPVSIPFFDVCNATTFCGDIELTTVLSNAGGSPNSNFCQSPSIIVTVEVNEPPVADFVVVDICEEENGGIGGAFPTVVIDAIGSSDDDLGANGDSLDFVWSSSDPGDVFSPATGMNVTSIDDISTMFTPGSTGPRTITLMLTDRFDCMSTTDDANTAYEINILPWDDDLCTILPIEMKAFKGHFKNESLVQLDWITANEINAAGFEVERKTDGGSFEKIATLNAIGYLGEETQYQYFDQLPSHLLRGDLELIYRVKEVDLDGSFEYSRLIVLNNDSDKNDIRLIGNPSYNKELGLNLSLKSNDFLQRIVIHDMLGNVQKVINYNESLEKGSYHKAIPTQDLSSGAYLISVVLKGETTTRKAIIF